MEVFGSKDKVGENDENISDSVVLLIVDFCKPMSNYIGVCLDRIFIILTNEHIKIWKFTYLITFY